MAFIKAGTLDPHGAPVLRQDIASNTVTFVVGDVLIVTSGFTALATEDVGVYGVMQEIETNKGVGVNTTGAAGASMGSYINSFVTSSTNQTVANVRTITDISMLSLYSAKIDNTPGTTTGSNLLAYFCDLADETQLDEDTTSASDGQFFLWGVDPLDATKVIASIHESIIFSYVV